ncbi:hypothetical protein IAR50_006786 [Cryptococcus sp. DSM 104548]
MLAMPPKADPTGAGSKKKRRQNVACDPCKLRRVKCDLATQLEPPPPTGPSAFGLPQPSTAAPLPLADLVRQNPGVECTQCRNKGIRCSTAQILNPTRPSKGGRRTDDAKRAVVGNVVGGDKDSPNANAPTGRLSGNPSVHSEMPAVEWAHDLLSTYGVYAPNNNVIHPPLFDMPPQSTHTSLPSRNTALHDSATGTTTIAHSSLRSSYQSSAQPSWYDDPSSRSGSIPLAWQQDHNATREASNLSEPSYLLPEPRGAHHSEYPQSSTSSIPAGPYFNVLGVFPHTAHSSPFPDKNLAGYPPPEPPVDFHSTREASNLSEPPSLLGEPHETNQNDHSRRPVLPAARIVERPGPYPNGLGAFPKVVTRVFPDKSRAAASSLPTESLCSEHPLQETRYDERSYFPQAEPAHDSPEGSSPVESKSVSTIQRTPSWGRTEGVQEDLSDMVLGIELSRHLINTFFQAVHYFYPAMSPELFYLEWSKAERRADRMTLGQEVLCAAMEAWGAQYSDSPIILGLSSASSAPRVIGPNGTFAPASEKRVVWGRARHSACNALLDRLRHLIDRNGVIRRPSIAGVQALTLYIELLFSSNETIKDEELLMEAHMIETTILEQMKILGLMGGAGSSSTVFDLRMPLIESRIKQMRLFWTQAIIDAFWSVSSARMPRMAEEKLETAGIWVNSVRDAIPSKPANSACKGLSIFVLCQYRIAKAGRRIAVEMAVPNTQGVIDQHRLCKDVRSIWKELESITKDLNSRAPGILRNCHKAELTGFSPLNYFTSIQLAGPFFLFHIHAIIKQQIESLQKMFVLDASEGPESTARRKEHLKALQDLQKDSLDMLLQVCRGHVKMIEFLLPTGILQTASVLLRVLAPLSKFLAETPTNEEGYPSSTPGGLGWTWKTKQKEVDVCVQALHQVGWAWSQVGDALDDIEVIMERSARNVAECASHAGTTELGVHDHTAALSTARQVDEKERAAALEAVMKFWPPAPVCNLFELPLKPENTPAPPAASRTNNVPYKKEKNGDPIDVSIGARLGDAFFPLGSGTKLPPWEETEAEAVPQLLTRAEEECDACCWPLG